MLVLGRVPTMKCAACGLEHDVLYIHSRCHPGTPTWVQLEGGQAFVICAACNALVVALGKVELLSDAAG